MQELQNTHQKEEYELRQQLEEQELTNQDLHVNITVWVT